MSLRRGFDVKHELLCDVWLIISVYSLYGLFDRVMVTEYPGLRGPK